MKSKLVSSLLLLVTFFGILTHYQITPSSLIQLTVADESKNDSIEIDKVYSENPEHHLFGFKSEGEQIIPFDFQTNLCGTPLELDFFPHLLGFSKDEKNVFAVNKNSFELVQINLENVQVFPIVTLMGVPNQWAISKDDLHVYFTYLNDSNIWHIDLTQKKLENFYSLKKNIKNLRLQPDNSKLYISYENCTDIDCLILGSKEKNNLACLESNIISFSPTLDGQKLIISLENKEDLMVIDLQSGVVEKPSSKFSDVPQYNNLLMIDQNNQKALILKEYQKEICHYDLKKNCIDSTIFLDPSLNNFILPKQNSLHAQFKEELNIAKLPCTFDASDVAEKHPSLIYEWNFGDGTVITTDLPKTIHTYQNEGTYKVSLKITKIISNFIHKKEKEELPLKLSSSIEKEIKINSTHSVLSTGFEKNALDEETKALAIFPSTTVGTPSQASIVYGQQVYDTAVVTGTFTGGTRTGTVTFFVDSTQIGSPVTLTPGPNNTATAVSVSYTPTTVGTYTFTAQYSGDAVYNPSSDSSVTNSFTVTQATSTTTLTSSVNPSSFGQNVTLTANVALNTTSNDLPTGTVTFYDGSNAIGTSSLIAGNATLAISNLSVGSHSLTAIYSGDVNYFPSTSNVLAQTVNKGNTSTTLTSSTNPSVFGKSTTLTATIAVTSGSGTVTGTVSFRDGATVIGTAPVTGGVATLPISNLAVGSHSLTAIYSGDTNFNTSTSNTVLQTVNQGTTTTTIASSANPSMYGQSITLTANVTVATGAGTLTGNVTFLDGTTVLGTTTLTAGTATLALDNLSVGTHNLTARYNGNTNFQISTSSNLVQVVDKATPVVTVSSASNPSAYGSEIVFTSLVSAPTSIGLPTGTVTFYDGSTIIGTGDLSTTGANTGTATFTTRLLNGGAHTITAVYGGDSNFVTVTSSPLNQTVNKANTTTTIFSNSSNPSEFGQPVTLQAQVIGSVSNPPLPPSGSVVFYDGTTVIGTVPVSAISSNTSLATFTTSSLSIGPHNLSASYQGDINYNISTSTTMTQTVILTSTSTTVATSVTPSFYGQNVTFTATVTTNSPGTGNPTGIVNFYNGTMLMGTGTLTPSGSNASQATFSITTLSLGSHQIRAIYQGDTNFTGSNSTAITQVVVKDPTTTSLSSSLNPSNFGNNVTFTANVTANAPGSGIPTGTVTFNEGSTVLGTATLNGSGAASITILSLYPGSHNITATYSGDTNYIGSTSPILTQIVNNQLPTTTTITSFRNSSPINQAVTYSARVTAITGIPTGTVSFYDGGVFFGTGTLNASGVATVTEPASGLNTLGLHIITAIYSGDANFITSTSANYNQYVVPYDTQTTLTSTPNHSEQANATFTATVTASGTPTPIPPFTGTITFYDGNTAISSPIPINPTTGVATFTPNDLQFGSRTIRAVYSGDQTTFATSTSNSITQQVQQTDMLTTTTSLTTSNATAYVCQPITLTATVVATQGFYTPTGTVTFFSDNMEIGGAILNASGVATLQVADLPIGIHTIQATYNSDSNYAFSKSNTLTETIIANPTTMALSVIPNLASTLYGQDLTFVAIVQSQYGIPAGSVTFYDGAEELLTIDLDQQATASLLIPSLDTGAHTINAVYNPTPCFSSSTAALSHTITRINPKTTLTASPSPAIYGNSILLQANVSAYLYGQPTGTVTFFNGSTNLGTVPVIEGIAQLRVFDLPASIVVFNARYNGDSNFIPTNFPSYLEIINKAPSSTCLTSFSPNPSLYGELVKFNATVSSAVGIPTGTVTFYNGSTIIGVSPIDHCGEAYLETSALNLGSNVISAVYSGDSNYLTSTSPNYTQTINQSASITRVVSSTPNPSTFNSTVTFTIAVNPANAGAANLPTGTITAYLGSTTLGVGTLTNGTTTISTSALPAGVSTINFVYSGDTRYSSSSAIATQTVNLATTTITAITSSQNPSVYGQSVTFSAKVNSTAGIPSGTATFFDGTTQLGVVTLDSSGNVAITVPRLAVGSHAITVRYAGNTTYAASNSASLTQVVNKSATNTTLTTTNAFATYGESITFLATVNPTSPGTGLPTGTVTFRNGTTVLGTVTLNNGGVAPFSISTLPASSTPYTLTATYNGDNNFNTSVSSNLSQTVGQVSTIINAVSSPNPSALGQVVTIAIEVNAINSGIVIPNGVVTATYGSTVIGTGSLDPNGQISFLTSTLPAGTLPITITYAGNSNFSPSSTIVTQTVTEAASAVALSSSLNPSHVGETITLTATVTSTVTGVPSGTVSFFDGNTLIGTQTLNGGGIATLSIANLTLGTHNLTAIYNGNASLASSVSSVLVQNVVQATTTTSIVSSVNPSSFNQATTFTATVAVGAGSGIPTGTVTFFDGTTALATRPLSGNVATFTTFSLTVGSHAIRAVYNGDTNFATSASTILTQVVNQTGTTTTLTSSLNPSTFEQNITLNASVVANAGTGIPTGTVTFRDGTTVIGTSNIVNGQASLTINTLSVGTHALTATYNSDGNFATSTSNTVSEVVNAASTTTTITSSINPTSFGQATILTAMVTSSTSITPTGTITFNEGSLVLGTASLVNGIATLNISNLSVGSHNINASYSGNGNFTGSTSSIITQVVQQATATVGLTSSINPSVYGDPIVLNASVTITSGSATPTGTIAFFDGTTLLGVSPLTAGTASITLTDLSVGTHSLIAVYSGDTNVSQSTSSTYVQLVNPGLSSIVLTSSVNPSSFGQAVTFTADLNILRGILPQTGTVAFLDGTTTLGTGTVVNGIATFTTTQLAIGSHSITAVYSGDANYEPVTSTPLTQVVTQAVTSTNILSTTPNPSMFGQTVNFFASVTSPFGSPSGTVSFYDNSVLLGTVPLFDGLAIFATPTLAIGNHPITAVYNGDANFLGSTSSPPTIQTVNQSSITVTTTTTLTSTPNPSNYGENVTFNITVTPIAGGGTPTGLVSLFNGGNALTTVSLDSSGQASFTTNQLPAGNLTIVALYSGDADYSSSTATIVQQVNPIGTTSTLTSSINPSNFGENVTFTFQVSSLSGPIPTGSATFYEGTTILGTSLLSNTGVATFNVSNLSTGTHAITAVYNQDANFQTTNASIVQNVALGLTSTQILTSAPNPSREGDDIIFVASVTTTDSIPNGTVTFYDQGTPIGTTTLYNGLAIFNASTLGVGTHAITAVYNGSSEFATSSSIPYTQIVIPAAFQTGTNLTSSLNPAEAGMPITFTATVISPSSTPTGTITFFDGSTSLGTAILNNGIAQLTVSNLSTGSHAITAAYSGDSNNGPSTSNTIIQVITASSIPQTPVGFYGCQVYNKYLTYTEVVNVLRWLPPENNASIVGYEVYKDSSLTKLVGKTSNSCPFQIEDRVKKLKNSYTYYIVSVNALGIKSAPASTTVYRKRHNKKASIEKDALEEIAIETQL